MLSSMLLSTQRLSLSRTLTSLPSSLTSSPLLPVVRCFTTTRPLAMPLDEFRDTMTRAERMKEVVGRQWSVRELRRKSYDDLHKLWYVLYKEKNMLLTEANLARRRSLMFPQPERQKKVKKSMGAIKHVLGERKRAAIAAHKERVKAAAAAGTPINVNSDDSNNNNNMMPAFDFHDAGDEFDDELGGDDDEDEKDTSATEIQDEGEGEFMEGDEDDMDEDDMDDDDDDDDKDNNDKKKD